LKYREAIRDALFISMRDNPRVFIMGMGVADPKGVFGTTLGLLEEFGPQRVFDIPLSENMITGAGIGSSMMGMYPIMVHQRIDFLLLAMDQIVNHAAKWKNMFGGSQEVYFLIRALVGRGWGQGPQHSQSLHSIFSHFPGLIVIAPSSAHDVKGLILNAIKCPKPVICIEHRWLYEVEDEVPEGYYTVPFGKASTLLEGNDVTLVSSSQMTLEMKKVTSALINIGVKPELIDLRTLNPIDKETIIKSVKKTGRIVVADGDWRSCGIASEILAMISENIPHLLKSPAIRVTWPNFATPTSPVLEKAFYPSALDLYRAALKVLGLKTKKIEIDDNAMHFLGPF
jgi:pyruvate dehydrogenase E1 component beta subunit